MAKPKKDKQRRLEEESILNVRQLLDELEQEEKATKRRLWLWMGLAGSIPVAFLIAVFVNASITKKEDADRASVACVSGQMSSRVADFRRKLRESEPDAPPGRVEMLVRQQHDEMEQQARTSCAGNTAK